ncbi:MAG: exodeoxyribonuclease VII large subunit [Butyrivibrio sp.]|nr:exodeoxyribonuclease VII large subunit [Butyrivibrio sp.]
MFQQDFLLQSLTVKGEISNCKLHSSGHIYFTLKDEKGALPCVMFRGDRLKGLSFEPVDGMAVQVTGTIDVYERDGRYQLYARRMERDGLGLLYERYEALKKELAERGMFAEEYKSPLPKYVRTLGVVTAPTGAAVRDIISVSTRRNPHIRILLYPAIVQGDAAAASIVDGIRTLSRTEADVLIVGRGGGSIEDLWAFNEEIVAEAIVNCPIPVISAVGHETDVTIADYVADRRAPTPSAAAELAVFEYSRFCQDLEDLARMLENGMEERLEEARTILAGHERALQFRSPQGRIRSQRERHAQEEERLIRAMQRTLQAYRQRLAIEDRLQQGMNRALERRRHRLDMDIERLKGRSPLDRLKSGYARVEDAAGHVVRSIDQAEPGMVLTLSFADGWVRAAAQEKGRYGGKEEGTEYTR